MHKQALHALAHPTFDPETQITSSNFWIAAPGVSACLTVNIGME
jgi:hypothetical protein